MPDILSAIYHDDPLSFQSLCCLDDPSTLEERQVVTQLRAVDEEIAEKLKPSIRILADTQAEQAFYSGVRFGAQLMAELMEQ